MMATEPRETGAADDVLVRVEGLHKSFGKLHVLKGVDFAVRRGEVVVVIGPSGSGKSTLLRCLNFLEEPQKGVITIGGVSVTCGGRGKAHKRAVRDVRLKCGMVFQEFNLFPHKSVTENVIEAPMLVKGLSKEAATERAFALLAKVGLSDRADYFPSQISGGQKQRVAIARALAMDPELMLFDEPTSALASGEVDVLHKVVRRLAAQGQAIIYVTHRLQEVPHVADSVTVLRDGRLIGTITAQEATPAAIAQMMIGSDWQRTQRGSQAQLGDVKLAVKNLSRNGLLKDVSFEVRGGEVLGLAGLLGSGRTELVRAIFGLDAVDAGEITVKGQRVTHPTPEKMKTHKVGLTPEDRKRQGLVLPFSVHDNLTIASMDRFSVNGVLQRAKAHAMAAGMVQSMDIKTPGLWVPTATLSGGNQQKVVVGNWLNTLPEVLLMDEPTRGIDIQAKEQIFTLVRDLAARGLAVVFISSEIEEVLDVADRILVMHEGRVTAEVKPDAVDLEQLLAMVMEETKS